MPRGRPKGSKNRTPEEKQKTRDAVEKAIAQNDINLGRDTNPVTFQDAVDLGVAMVKKDFERAKAAIKEYIETPFPENWDKMGKVDRLKWLTANKK